MIYPPTYIYTYSSILVYLISATLTAHKILSWPQLNTTIIAAGVESYYSLILFWHRIYITHNKVLKPIPNIITYFLQYGKYHPEQISENPSCTLQYWPIKANQGKSSLINGNKISQYWVDFIPGGLIGQLLRAEVGTIPVEHISIVLILLILFLSSLAQKLYNTIHSEYFNII